MTFAHSTDRKSLLERNLHPAVYLILRLSDLLGQERRTYREEVLCLRDADEYGRALREPRQHCQGQELFQVISNITSCCNEHHHSRDEGERHCKSKHHQGSEWHLKERHIVPDV